MRLLVPPPCPSNDRRRGAALMLAMMVMIVLILIVFQITLGSATDARVAKNDTQLANFDAAIESALHKALQDLADDGETEDAGAGAGGIAGGLGGGLGPGEGGETGPVDSRRDTWAMPQQTSINEVQLRVLVQDENSKYNVLTMLTENEEEAEKAYNRVVRILDACREGTLHDIDSTQARDMAEGMRTMLRQRRDTVLPKPVLLTDLQEEPDLGMPMSLSEFVVLPGFEEFHFRDFYDAEGSAVHSIGSFLTVWTSLKRYSDYVQDLQDEGGVGSTPVVDDPGVATTNEDGGLNAGADGSGLGDIDDALGAGAGGGSEGYAVNINTAPAAVLRGLFDRRDVPWDVIDELVRYRNEEDEEATDPDAEPVYDEFGEEVVMLQIFESVQELNDVEGYEYIDPDVRQDLERFLTVESSVFSVFVTARASTARDGEDGFDTTPEAELERRKRGTDRLKTVRLIVWRFADEDEVRIVPVEAWEVLDYMPIEVQDYPDTY